MAAKKKRSKVRIEPPVVRMRVYGFVSDRLELAIKFGYNRAHKHTSTPEADHIQDQIHKEVMMALVELFVFPDD